VAGPAAGPVYPSIFIDCLTIEIRDSVVANRPMYLTIGVDCDVYKKALSLWVGPTTGNRPSSGCRCSASSSSSAWRGASVGQVRLSRAVLVRSAAFLAAEFRQQDLKRDDQGRKYEMDLDIQGNKIGPDLLFP